MQPLVRDALRGPNHARQPRGRSGDAKRRPNVKTQRRLAAVCWSALFGPSPREATITINAYQSSTPVRVLAIVARFEAGQNELLSPDLVSGSSWILPVIFVPLGEVGVNGFFAFLYRLVIAVMDHSLCHTTEHRFYDVEKLGRRGKWG